MHSNIEETQSVLNKIKEVKESMNYENKLELDWYEVVQLYYYLESLEKRIDWLKDETRKAWKAQLK